MSPLLFLLVLLGFGQCQLFLGSSADDGSGDVVKAFIGSLVKILGSEDKSDLGGLFSDDFLFQGCRGVYNKQKVLGMLNSLPAGTKLQIQLISSQFVDDNHDIYYRVKADGFGPSLDAEFFLYRRAGKYVLIGGRIPECTHSHFDTISLKEDDGSTMFVNVFNDGFNAALQSTDEALIGSFFSENFLFHGCHGDYTKKRFVSFLASHHTNPRVKATVVSSKFTRNGADIENDVSITGLFGFPLATKILLRVENEKYVLAGGSVLDCTPFHVSSYRL